MKFFNHLLFLSLSMSLPVFLSAQETDTGGTQNIDELSEATLRGMTQVYDKNYDDVTGGPFFYQTWLPGEVTLENGSTYGVPRFSTMYLMIRCWLGIRPATKSRLLIKKW